MKTTYDAIVVGARCAGSPTAMLLARKGYRVLMVDRSSFPSDIMSTHYVHLPGVQKLRQWGLLDQVIASNCPPVTKMVFDFGPFTIAGSPPPLNGTGVAYCPRRTVLDIILVEAAVKAGVEFHEGVFVDEILRDGDRVTGIRGRSRNGAAVSVEAPITIGADGLHSFLARSVRAPSYDERPSRGCAYYSYFSGVEVDSWEVHIRPGRACFALPTNDGKTVVGAARPSEEFHEYRSDIEGNFWEILDLVPEFAERVRAGRREERFIGTADLPFFFRKPYGNGWALVGDAGYHKDPNTAQGITDAFRDAELLADAIDVGFSGREPLDEAMAKYEQARNEAVRQMYEFTYELAALEPPPPEMQQVFAAVAGNQTESDRFTGIIAGTVKPDDFFSPDSIARITGAQAVAR